MYVRVHGGYLCKYQATAKVFLFWYLAIVPLVVLLQIQTNSEDKSCRRKKALFKIT